MSVQRETALPPARRRRSALDELLAAVDVECRSGDGGVRHEVEGEGGDVLRGTKHRASTLQEVTVARGGTDGRTVVLIPEIRQGTVDGLTLLHARFADRLPGETMRAVLEGYQARYGALVDAVTETASFDDARLGELPVIDLLTSPVHVLAEAWRR